MTDAYDLFQQGRAHLKEGMAAQATVALEKAKRLEPAKASIREALGIAYFRIQRWPEAEAEFRAVLELSPTDDYAHYALGRALEKQGRDVEANGHFKLASLALAGQRALRRADQGPGRLRAVLQRVSRASVAVDGVVRGEIGPGLVVLLGVGEGDDEADAERLAGKVARLRSSRTTTAASTARCSTPAAPRSSSASSRCSRTRAKGNRPSFSAAARPEVAEPLYERFCEALRELGVPVETGVFGARMQVELVNDGPVTIVLDAWPGRRLPDRGMATDGVECFDLRSCDRMGFDQLGKERNRGTVREQAKCPHCGGWGSGDVAAVLRQAARDRARAAADREAAAREREEARRALAEAERELKAAATDELTGAWTRRFGFVQIVRELERERRTGDRLTVAFLDVDGLKSLNDSEGHAAGDRLLRLAVDTMRTHLRPYDVVVRYGGDEFLCAMPDTGTDAARERMTGIAATLTRERSLDQLRPGRTSARRGPPGAGRPRRHRHALPQGHRAGTTPNLIRFPQRASLATFPLEEEDRGLEDRADRGSRVGCRPGEGVLRRQRRIRARRRPQRRRQLSRRAIDSPRLGLLDCDRQGAEDGGAGDGQGTADRGRGHRGRADRLVDRGVDASDFFHFGEGGQTAGLHPERETYGSFFSFDDPDGNAWLVQEVKR